MILETPTVAQLPGPHSGDGTCVFAGLCCDLPIGADRRMNRIIDRSHVLTRLAMMNHPGHLKSDVALKRRGGTPNKAISVFCNRRNHHVRACHRLAFVSACRNFAHE